MHRSGIETVAETIVYMAKERLERGEKYQNLNSAIHAVKLEVTDYLMEHHMQGGKS